MSYQEAVKCPLCLEAMDITDQHLKPCKCGYEICVWCWNYIIEMAEKEGIEGQCPACRSAYDKENILKSAQRLAEVNIKKERKSQKAKAKMVESRKHLTDVRVVRRNLVYVAGIPLKFANDKTLRKDEFFGQYGKVIRVVVIKASETFQNSRAVYVTYSKEEEAVRCIEVVNGYVLDGSSLRACFGATRYCSSWLNNMPCQASSCFYLHELCPEEDSCDKDQVATACISKLQKYPGIASTNVLRRSGSTLPPPVGNFDLSGKAIKEKREAQSVNLSTSNALNRNTQNETDQRKHTSAPAATWPSSLAFDRPSHAQRTANQPLMTNDSAMHAIDEKILWSPKLHGTNQGINSAERNSLHDNWNNPAPFEMQNRTNLEYPPYQTFRDDYNLTNSSSSLNLATLVQSMSMASIDDYIEHYRLDKRRFASPYFTDTVSRRQDQESFREYSASISMNRNPFFNPQVATDYPFTFNASATHNLPSEYSSSMISSNINEARYGSFPIGSRYSRGTSTSTSGSAASFLCPFSNMESQGSYRTRLSEEIATRNYQSEVERKSPATSTFNRENFLQSTMQLNVATSPINPLGSDETDWRFQFERGLQSQAIGSALSSSDKIRESILDDMISQYATKGHIDPLRYGDMRNQTARRPEVVGRGESSFPEILRSHIPGSQFVMSQNLKDPRS